MKIEKKKVSTAIAATFGMAAVFTLNACDDSTSANSDPADNNFTEPESSSQLDPGSSASTEGPATSSQAEDVSSSSKPVDIPLSHEPLSSEAADALSAIAEPTSSETAPASSEATETSSAEAPASSADAPLSSEAAPESSGATPASSATPSSSSINSWGDTCPEDDAWCINIHMCEGQSGCMVASMVTTFERDDITG